MAKIIKHNKPHWFYEEIYGVNIYFAPGYQKKDVEASILCTFKREIKIRDGYGGVTIEFEFENRYGIYIWLDEDIKSNYNLKNLHHEIIHAAGMILDRAGVHASFDNDEPLTYLSSWLFGKCLEKLK